MQRQQCAPLPDAMDTHTARAPTPKNGARISESATKAACKGISAQIVQRFLRAHIGLLWLQNRMFMMKMTRKCMVALGWTVTRILRAVRHFSIGAVPNRLAILSPSLDEFPPCPCVCSICIKLYNYCTWSQTEYVIHGRATADIRRPRRSPRVGVRKTAASEPKPRPNSSSVVAASLECRRRVRWECTD